ncbi:hypothetical protein [Chamaesiphon minutus]|uniref:Uncharacterized protein n=1 Tax=Chamaesiphon minutus (strain ATCC 27169 / PCC 6605) TaxID=1173020 RepID=K9UHK7_CHAP6|nr:hypothetical protein [Chamaesiphon minutus]AFY94138.1 hypothetical protein Cha6605_3116 [Chamaesiphon minutus PCC 6605]
MQTTIGKIPEISTKPTQPHQQLSIVRECPVGNRGWITCDLLLVRRAGLSASYHYSRN